MVRFPFVLSPDDNGNATRYLPNLLLDGGPHRIDMAADAPVVNF
jgi:hypothetical protein